MRIFKRLLAAESGSIMVLAALALTGVMGMTGLAVEVGNGYAAKVRNQRVSDMAALGAAVAYQGTSSSAQAVQTAKDIVSASGLPASAATVVFGVNNGVSVQITTAVPVRLASLLTNNVSYNVTTTGVASLGNNTSPGCILSLNKTATYGVRVTGSTTLNASGCSVTSNSPISVEGSSNITAASITGPSIATSGTSTVNGTRNTGSSATDPLANFAALAAAFAKIGTGASSLPTAPTIPSSSTNWSFPSSAGGYTALVATDPVKVNCTLSGQAFTCNQGTYNINNFTLPSGMSVTFSGSSTVNVYGTFSANGATLNGTGAQYNLRNAYSTNWSTSPTFGNIAGLYVGGAVSYSGTGNSIGTGNVTFAGGLSVGGSSVLTIGAGSHAFAGAIDVGGSGSLTIGAGSLIVTGDFTVGGSASASLGAGNHIIDGNMNLNGGGTLGAGRYTIGGNFIKTASLSVTGNAVTIIAGGYFNTGGAASLTLTAPAADDATTGAMQSIAFASKSSAASSIDGSSSNTLAGVIYLPNSDMAVTGAGSVSTTTCTAFIVKTLAVSGSATLRDTGCTSPVVATGGAISLIQ